MTSRRPAEDDAMLAQIEDADLVALTAEGEARGEPVEGQIGVMSAIRNRVQKNRAAWGGASYRAVCLAYEQFDCWDPQFGGDDYRFLMSIARQIVSRTIVPANRPVLRQCRYLAPGIINGDLQDNVHGATHYATTALIDGGKVRWAIGQRPVVTIGHHSFFANIA